MGGTLLKADGVRLVMYIVGVLLSLVMTYLLLKYSVTLGVLWVGLLVFVVAMVRKNRGTKTRLEQQAFERADHYRKTAQRAYEEGKHREIAQNAYQQSKKVYEEAQTRYRQWNEAQAVERERNKTLKAIEREREIRRRRFDRYGEFFERARSGAKTSLEWWRAYEDEGAGEGEQTTDELLLSTRTRAEAGLRMIKDYEEAFANLLQADSLAEVDDFLGHVLASQENFEGEESVFPPLVVVHDRIKHSDDWTKYREELERFIKDLEDTLDSPLIRTAPANRVRFPDPAQTFEPADRVRFPDPAQTPDFRLPTTPRPSRVALNTASEQEIASLPGVGVIIAKRAVGLRVSRGGFRSVEDFGQALNLQPHIIERIRPLVSVSTPQQPGGSNPSGRVVDF